MSRSPLRHISSRFFIFRKMQSQNIQSTDLMDKAAFNPSKCPLHSRICRKKPAALAGPVWEGGIFHPSREVGDADISGVPLPHPAAVHNAEVFRKKFGPLTMVPGGSLCLGWQSGTSYQSSGNPKPLSGTVPVANCPNHKIPCLSPPCSRSNREQWILEGESLTWPSRQIIEFWLGD